MFNGVTTVIVRDGFEIEAGCLLAFLATRAIRGWSSIKLAMIAFVIAVPTAFIAHHFVSQLDERWRPLELFFNLAIPAYIAVYCFRHLPGGKPPDIKSVGFAPTLVAAETTEVTISTLGQSGHQMLVGVTSGLLILGLATAVALIAVKLLQHNFGDLVSRNIGRTMALLNPTVGGFGLYVLFNAREPLGEYHAMWLWPYILTPYLVALVVIVAITIKDFPTERRSQHHHST